MDREVARLAARQHGVVSRAQLLDAGLDRHAIVHRLDRGRLHVVHRGVYAVGYPVLKPEGRWMAAVLATGGVASHRAAGAIWEVLTSERIEVTAATYKQRPGIRVHRSRLPQDEITVERGIPVTTVPRTLLDLAAVLARRHLARAVNEVEIRRVADPQSVWGLIDRYPNDAAQPP